MQNTLINIGLIVAYIGIFAAIIALLFFAILSIFKGDSTNSKKSLIGIGALIVCILLAYIISPADQGPFYEKFNVGPQQSKIIGTGLVSSYFLFVALIVIILYTSVIKMFKKS